MIFRFNRIVYYMYNKSNVSLIETKYHQDLISPINSDGRILFVKRNVLIDRILHFIRQ